MAKQIRYLCDYCGIDLHPGNWFANEDLCDDCRLLADLAGEAARQDLIKKAKPGTTALGILRLYEESGE